MGAPGLPVREGWRHEQRGKGAEDGGSWAQEDGASPVTVVG